MNKTQEAERRQIKTDIKCRIKRGEPKQQILEELSYIYKDKISIMKRLESTPSNSMKYKYRMHNYLLAALMLFALAFDVTLLFLLSPDDRIVYGSAVINIALDVTFIIGTLMYRSGIYSWISVRALVSLIIIAVSHLYYFEAVHYFVYVSLLLAVASFILGMMLGIKLCPSRVPKTIEVEIDGAEKIKKNILVFPD